MTPEDVIRGFCEGVEHTSEEKEYANTLFQEAIKIGMEINQTYHTPEELLKLMGKLTGKAVDKSFRLFPPFYTDFGKNIIFGKDVFINSGCHFQDQGGIEIGDGVLIGHNVVLATINMIFCHRITGRTIMPQLKLEIMYGLVRMLQCYPVLPLENGQLLQPEQ